MAKVTLYLDVRAQKKDGTYPVKIKLSHKTKTKMERTGVDVKRNEWDEEYGEIIGNTPLRKQLNLKLKRTLVQLQMALYDIEAYKDISNMTIDTLMREMRENAGFEVRVKRTLFMPFFLQEIEKKETENTRERYITTKNHLLAFEKNMENLSFEDITEDWLKKYDQWMKEPHGRKKGLSQNSRVVNLRNIKTIFTEAIKQRVTTNDPFRNIELKVEQTMKRSLSIQEMHDIWHYETDSRKLRFVLDMFKLTFCLIGINPIDLYNAKKEQIEGGRLIYKRAKTGRLYSVRITPEAQEIIDKYKGRGEYLLKLHDRYNHENSFKQVCNVWLKKVDKRLSLYWARHTWATTASELDVPNETISGAMGHSYGLRVTNIYIRFDQRKIDKANRRIIDAVKNNYNPFEDEEEELQGDTSQNTTGTTGAEPAGKAAGTGAGSH